MLQLFLFCESRGFRKLFSVNFLVLTQHRLYINFPKLAINFAKEYLIILLIINKHLYAFTTNDIFFY